MRTRLVLILPLLLVLVACAAPASREEAAAPPGSDAGAPGGGTANVARDSNAILTINASQYGVGYPETFVLLQNRKGLRIEYCVDRSRLQIWVSPKAGTSMEARDKNWSNRDDHTDVFDRILLPGLNLAEFERADYDPFHSVLYFKSQTLHVAHVYDEPAALVWLEKPGNVDLKTANTDRALSREPREFVIGHEDRGRAFEWAATLGPGEGTFRHQLVLDEGRSIYTRAEMTPGQLLVLGAGLKGEGAADMARRVAARSAESILETNEAAITKDLEYGRFTLRGREEMQKLLEKNRRVALSMQDFNGFMRSTNQYIYYLLWYRDGGMNTGHLTMAGWTDPARQHVPFALANPNVSLDEPKGRFFGQVMGGALTKWQEDGLFYVVWPAFLYWTQTGDRSFLEGERLATIEEALDWLERRAFDEEKGLFGRFFFVETPMKGTRDFGFDNVTGAPTDYYVGRYEGEAVTRGYDIYVNALSHAVYMMLAAATDGDKAATYLEKAKGLEEAMRRFFDTEGPLPSYGDLQVESGRVVATAPYGMDRTDYQWALSLPKFDVTSVENQREARAQLLRDLKSDPKDNFVCAWAAILTSMDTEFHDEKEIMDALDYLVPQSVRPGKYLPMAYSIPELVDVEDGQPFHDVRPLVYSIAPWLSAVTNFGLHRLPLGVAIRGTELLESIDRYRYRDSVLDVRFEGEGVLESVTLNGEPLRHTLQVPDGALRKGDNALVVTMAPGAPAGERLSSSTVRLDSAITESGVTRFEIMAIGQNRLTFGDLTREVSVLDASGTPVEVRAVPDGSFTHVYFDGRGSFTVTLRGD
jgi:hypothetical protein